VGGGGAVSRKQQGNMVTGMSPFPQAIAKAFALSSVDCEVCRAAINSTSFWKNLRHFSQSKHRNQRGHTMTGTGLKKCRPAGEE